MSKDIFTPVNYDEAFPPAPQATASVVPETPKTAAEVVEAINAELQRIQLGTSKMTPHAVQVREGSTPFLHSLKTFSAEPTVDNAVALVSISKQDFSATFARYVESLVTPLFKGVK